jgi:large subunit ribosomal protein L6e
VFKYEGPKAVEGVKGKYYPADDVKVVKGVAPKRNAPRVRASITPGTVLILLAGRFQGKRVVALKTLSSGLILVNGKSELVFEV